MPILEASGVHAGYGETEILHGVSIQLEGGEFVTIIGPNGAGKSTLIKAIIGLLKPTKGRIQFQDREITGENPEDLVLDGLAYVPQMSNTFPTLTVRENLEMGAITRRPGWGIINMAPYAPLVLPFALLAPRRTARWLGRSHIGMRRHHAGTGDAPRPAPPLTELQFEETVREICGIFPNLKPKLDERVSTLSGGEQQMVALAKALVLDPKVLLIDEPSAGLAPRLVQMIFEKIREINEGGVGVVLVEQNARKALSMADRGYVLEAGKNRYEGPGKALLNDPEMGRLYLGG